MNNYGTSFYTITYNSKRYTRLSYTKDEDWLVRQRASNICTHDDRMY